MATEAIRLNELFARPQKKCKNRQSVGGKKETFFVCLEGEGQGAVLG